MGVFSGENRNHPFICYSTYFPGRQLRSAGQSPRPSRARNRLPRGDLVRGLYWENFKVRIFKLDDQFLSRPRGWCVVGLAMLAVILCPRASRAFPTDPARIFARDQSPTPGKFEIEASVWQGGEPYVVDTGKLIYRERRTIDTEPDGHFDFWLDETLALEGNLRGGKIGLDQTLRMQLKYHPPGEELVELRFILVPIDNAYIASRPGIDHQPGKIDEFRGQYSKSYSPDFSDVEPIHVRRGRAILYPDGRLQTETGSYHETTGTTTSGVQEFFDYCTNHHVDGYIVGGSIPRKQQVIYRIWTPLRMHPAQGIRIDTGAITLKFMPDLGDQPGLTIDSCMMNDIRIRGLLHYVAKGYALAIKPENPLPLDRFVGNTIVDSAVFVTAIACSGARGAVRFEGSINFCRFDFNEINHGQLGIHVAPGGSFSNCRITCKHVHGQTETSILDEGSAKNVWEVNLNCDAKDPLGIVTNGQDNIWFTNINSRTNPGLTLKPNARGNQFFLMGLNGGYDNQAIEPTNRFYASPSTVANKLKLGFAVHTPSVPVSGELLLNRNPFPVVVMIKSPGSVSLWELNDTYGNSDKFESSLHTGQSIYLSPGEGLRLHYAERAPEWRWRAVQ